MISCYLNSLLQEFIRIIASHLPQRGCFEVYQASVTLLDKLLSLI
jgi:hypothetical protein